MRLFEIDLTLAESVKQNVLEARDSPLYHFTSWNNLGRILTSNQLVSPSGKIYFTRDYNRQFIPHDSKLFDQPYGIRIDQNLLRRDYGKKLKAGGQNTRWDEKKRQAWLADPKNAEEIKLVKQTGKSTGRRDDGADVKDIVNGTITQKTRWESEEHLDVKSVPNLNKYLTGIVIGNALGEKHLSLVSNDDPLTKLADVLIHLFPGSKGFDRRNALLYMATKLGVPIVYLRKDFDPEEVKKRIIQLYSQRKKEREEEQSKTQQYFIFLTNPDTGGGISISASDVASAIRKLANNFKYQNRKLYGYTIDIGQNSERKMFDEPGTALELLKTLKEGI